MDNELKKHFLYFLGWARRNHGYASGAKGENLLRGGSEFRCERGQFSYWDQYWGFNPFIGQEMVWHGDIGWLWGMNYYGKAMIETQRASAQEIFKFLKSALLNSKFMFRGPRTYAQGDLVYETECEAPSLLDRFCGTERIYYKNVLVYRGEYHGGFIGQKSP